MCDWSKESVAALKGSFDCMEWRVFVGSSHDVCELSDVLSEYIIFYEDCVIPRETVKIYANNKPWVTRNIKHLFNMKKKVFLKQDKNEMKEVQRELTAEIRRGKEEYQRNIEDNLKCKRRQF